VNAWASTIPNQPTGTRPRLKYDLPTAVTFLLAGMALGGVLTLLFSPWPIRDHEKTSMRTSP